MELGDVVRERRRVLGMSQADLARAIGVDARQVRRYEAGEQQPLFPVAVAIARALDLSLTDLAGAPEPVVDLTGDWFAVRRWDGASDGSDGPVQHIRLVQQPGLLRLEPVGDAVALRSAELRRPDAEPDRDVLVGWFTAVEAGTPVSGVLFLVQQGSGRELVGRWAGRSAAGALVGGRAVLARRPDAARTLLDDTDAPG